MKTLDEVIETAPYVGTEWTNDALHYLKEYRDHMKNEIIELQEEVKKQKEMIEFLEKPLTWDKLKQMFHKPIWIETKTKKGWVIINNFEAVTPSSENMNVIHTSHRGAKYSHFARHLMGQTWQAYRKERK